MALVTRGVWDGSTNTPTLANGVGSYGDIYYINPGGTQDLGAGSVVYNPLWILLYTTFNTYLQFPTIDSVPRSYYTPTPGSVVSVGLQLPSSVFTVSGSPVTVTGTLVGTLNTQDANYGWIGPASGSPAAPTFRAFVSADIPTLTNGQVGISGLSATGTPSSTTYLRGDNTWDTLLGVGTVTIVSVVNTNGFNATIANATTTPAITMECTVTGLLKANGTAISAAIGDTDYQNPITLTTTGSTGAATFSGDVLNIPQYAGTTYSAGTGLTLTSTTFSVNVSQDITTLSNLTGNGLVYVSGGTGTLGSGPLSGDITTSALVSTIGANKVTYAKMQQTSAGLVLIGNPTGSVANIEEITLGSGLSFSGTTLVSTGSGGTVTSVTGTTGQIDVATGTTTPVISIDTSYIGQTSITTLGTITTGTWNGTAINGTYIVSSVALAGNPTTTTQGPSDNSTRIATTAYVTTAISNYVVPATSINGTSITFGSSNTITAAAGTLTGTTLNSTVVTSSLTSVGTIGTGVWQGTAIATAYIANNAITYAKLQAASTNSVLIGTPSTGTAYQEITLGTGLAMTAGVLSSTGGGGTPGGSNTDVQYNNSGVFGGNSNFTYDGTNVTTNNIIQGLTSIATAAGTTTLTNASTYEQDFTGTTTQTVVLPVVSTLSIGFPYLIVNYSTGVVTVQSSGGNIVQAVQSGGALIVKCILTSGTTAASWDIQYAPPYVSANVDSTIVYRDSSGNFAAANITATSFITSGGTSSEFVMGDGSLNTIIIGGSY